MNIAFNAKNYQDKNTMWHDKPVVSGEPSSNNGWIYSAYSVYLAPKSLNYHKLNTVYIACTRSLGPVKIDRLPGMKTPPMSKDEIIGLVSLGFLSVKDLEASSWNFCNLEGFKHRKLSVIRAWRAAKALYSIKNEHRNYVWENNMVDAYPLVFRLAPWDVYYCKAVRGYKTSMFEKVCFYLNALNVIRKGGKSARMMLLLQLKDLKHELLEKVPERKWVYEYFGDEHCFYANFNKEDQNE